MKHKWQRLEILELDKGHKTRERTVSDAGFGNTNSRYRHTSEHASADAAYGDGFSHRVESDFRARAFA